MACMPNLGPVHEKGDLKALKETDRSMPSIRTSCSTAPEHCSRDPIHGRPNQSWKILSRQSSAIEAGNQIATNQGGPQVVRGECATVIEPDREDDQKACVVWRSAHWAKQQDNPIGSLRCSGQAKACFDVSK